MIILVSFDIWSAQPSSGIQQLNQSVWLDTRSFAHLISHLIDYMQQMIVLLWIQFKCYLFISEYIKTLLFIDGYHLEVRTTGQYNIEYYIHIFFSESLLFLIRCIRPIPNPIRSDFDLIVNSYIFLLIQIVQGHFRNF